MNINLEGKTALVCGASKGIGKAIALEMANSGANVILVARSLPELVAVHAALPDNDKHKYIVADLQEPRIAVEIIKTQLPVQDKLDILVNNTSGPPAGKLYKADIEEFSPAFERHLFASHCLVQAFLPNMINNNWGRIINIISISVRQPVENLGVSNTVRGAMASWSKTLSCELGGYGITVNNILPGYTATERLYYLIDNMASHSGITNEVVEEKLKSQVPAGRFAAPEEIGYLAAFLSSDKAAFINGANIPIDGGFLKSM